MTYDSRPETEAHIARVQELLEACIARLKDRAANHDASKLVSPEKELLDHARPKLRKHAYNSTEYQAALAEVDTFLEHHYKANSHHPEHYPLGISGMSLFDILEMLMDWKAAGEKQEGGTIENSLKENKKRFHIGPQLDDILWNTAQEMGWLDWAKQPNKGE